jgi:hypothetical protein
MSDWNSFIDTLVEDTAPIPIKKTTEKQFPCGQCAGTGVYSGVRVHQEKTNCFACRGKGYFKTDPRKLEKARVQRATKKQAAIASAQALNAATPIFDQVFAMASWNELSASLAEQHNAGRAWSEKQVLAISSMVARMEERRAQRAAEAPSVDLRLIVSMFAHARDKGYKRPIYRAEGLKISLAPATGANAGALYVKTDEDQYIGKVVDQQFFASRDATDEHKTALSVIAQSPRDAAIRYGQKTGHCACCGRALSNRQSVDLGIGPICAGKWGFM